MCKIQQNFIDEMGGEHQHCCVNGDIYNTAKGVIYTASQRRLIQPTVTYTDKCDIYSQRCLITYKKLYHTKPTVSYLIQLIVSSYTFDGDIHSQRCDTQSTVFYPIQPTVSNTANDVLSYTRNCVIYSQRCDIQPMM